MTLKQRKREKSIALKTMHEEKDSSEEDNDDELALLTKNFKKFLKKVDKSSKSGSSFPNTFRGKSSSKNSYFLNNKKRIQCKECEGLGHLQSECAKTRKKKNKALKSTWSDEESDGSQEEDNLVSNQVAFSSTLVSGNYLFIQRRSGSVVTNIVCLSAKLDIVVTDSKSTTSNLSDSDLDYRDESN